MKIKYLLVLAALTVGIALQFPSRGHGAGADSSLRQQAERAVSPNPAVSAAAIKALRAQGAAGLEALLAANAGLIHEHQTNAAGLKDSAAWQRLQAALDGVGAQRDCAASHLYWYTNFDDAKAAAKASGKPILSLRLLGNLNEEYSCANSRFFRTTLYANAEVSQYLRDNFILHWKSVRPVPRITIDFGDGRKIERTITGNSIHYILDNQGRVIDALPGLYGPKAFLNGLRDAREAAVKSSAMPVNQAVAYLAQYHGERYSATMAAWRKDVEAVGSSGVTRVSEQPGEIGTPPTAFAAARPTIAKGMVELTMIKSIQSAQTTDDATWTRIAARHTDDVVLDPASVALLRSKNPTVVEAARVAISKSRVEDPMSRAVWNLQRSIAEDTVRNEYQLHSQLHQWFMNGSAPADLEQLNRMVYAKLFLTPDTDPWLGLVPADTITALDGNGLVQPKR